MEGVPGQRRVRRDEVRLAQQLVQRARLDPVLAHHLRLDEGIEGHHPQTKGLRAHRHLAGDVAEGDQAQRAAAQLLDVPQRRPRLRPPPAAGQQVAVHDLALGGQQQGKRLVSNLVHEQVGHVADDDAGRGRRLDVDRIDADAAVGDDLAAPQLADHARRQSDAWAGDDRVGVGDGCRVVGFAARPHRHDARPDRIERLALVGEVVVWARIGRGDGEGHAALYAAMPPSRRGSDAPRMRPRPSTTISCTRPKLGP
jgi:hypothetical protein